LHGVAGSSRLRGEDPRLFSRMVVGGRFRRRTTGTWRCALSSSARRRCPEAGLLHHTDQGSTYASEDYQRVLAAHGITCQP